MNCKLLSNLWKVISGMPPVDDLVMIWEEVKNNIIGNLHREFLYDHLEIWSDNWLFLEQPDEFKEYLINQLNLYDDSKRAFAQRLVATGINITEGVPTEKTKLFEIKLPDESHIWYSLKRAKLSVTKLAIDCNGTKKILEPGRYKVGRGEDGENKPDFILINDTTLSISKEQIRLFFHEGKWKCQNLSSHCKTLIQHYDETRDVRDEPIALTENHPYPNTITFYNPKTQMEIKLYYSFLTINEDNGSENSLK